MSKYSHFEMCEKIFGNRYKFDERTQDYIPYSRTDMWNKLLELQEENKQLEEQHDLLIDEFQEEREKLCKQIKQESDARERFVEKVKQLKKHLAEKDKEIEGTDSNLTYKQIQIDNLEKENKKLKEQLTQVRKQVCDEIRDKLKAHCDYTDEENIGWYLTEHKIDMLLDQIEQAKESIDE